VSVGRPDTSRDLRRARAIAIGPGRFAADSGVQDRGPWLVAFEVARGGDRMRLEKSLEAGGPCDLAGGPCTLALPGGGEIAFELGPRPLRAMRELAAVATLTSGGAPLEGAAVEVALVMPGMEMGENRIALRPDAPGRHVGRVTVVRCMSGRRDWVAEVSVAGPGGARRTLRFPFTVAE
jgi:hypothetical protein